MDRLLFPLLLLALLTVGAEAKDIYVSKLGRGTDGASWATAFTTIQAALDAVPAGGGYRIVVRPDTYFEANLAPAQQGTAGAYNALVGDTDGKLGGGRTGWVVIDSGDPEQKGFKSYDWWSTIRATSKGWSPAHTDETFSSIGWDRWRFAGLYTTGGDAGIFFDGTNQVKPFSVVVEDCVCIGRAFGGGVASVLSRTDEPITFRRCWLWSLDTWGDTGAAYIRVENKQFSEQPDAVLEDCTLVSPQCALKSSNFGFDTYSHIAVRRCRLVVTNFSQPVGEPSKGAIVSVQEGRTLWVDLEDSTVAGYKVFGVIVKPETVKDIRFTTKGDVKAYLQFQQDVPKGFYRLPHWPVELFTDLTPPPIKPAATWAERKLITRDLCELTPLVWQGRLVHMECRRPATGGTAKDYYLAFVDAETGRELGRCAEGYGLASAIVHNGQVYAFASRWSADGWHDVTMFSSKDLKTWTSAEALKGENEGVFNTSVCAGRDGFVMAYEVNDPAYPAFTIKFATSKDLTHWTKLPQATFGTNRYTACPCVRYVDGYYYVLYLEHRAPRHYFETYVTRSKDLLHWELSSANPVLSPEGLDEGVNASDPDLVEFGGRTLLYYAVGDQLTWANIKRVAAPGTLKALCAQWYRQPGVPDWGSVGSAK